MRKRLERIANNFDPTPLEEFDKKKTPLEEFDREVEKEENKIVAFVIAYILQMSSCIERICKRCKDKQATDTGDERKDQHFLVFLEHLPGGSHYFKSLRYSTHYFPLWI